MTTQRQGIENLISQARVLLNSYRSTSQAELDSVAPPEGWDELKAAATDMIVNWDLPPENESLREMALGLLGKVIDAQSTSLSQEFDDLTGHIALIDQTGVFIAALEAALDSIFAEPVEEDEEEEEEEEEAPPPLISNLSCSTGRVVTSGILQVGGQFFTDRTFTITGLPSNLDNQALILTPNDDKQATGDYLSFTLGIFSEVYVMLDARFSSRPGWLSTWTDTGLVVQTSDGDRHCYSKVFPPGPVHLGGNEAPSNGGYSMYNVVVVPG